MFISFCSSKKKRTKEKGRRNRGTRSVTSSAKPNDNFSLFWQNAFGVTLPKKAEVRAISGLPSHVMHEITVNN